MAESARLSTNIGRQELMPTHAFSLGDRCNTCLRYRGYAIGRDFPPYTKGDSPDIKLATVGEICLGPVRRRQTGEEQPPHQVCGDGLKVPFCLPPETFFTNLAIHNGVLEICAWN